MSANLVLHLRIYAKPKYNNLTRSTLLRINSHLLSVTSSLSILERPPVLKFHHNFSTHEYFYEPAPRKKNMAENSEQRMKGWDERMTTTKTGRHRTVILGNKNEFWTSWRNYPRRVTNGETKRKTPRYSQLNDRTQERGTTLH